MLQTIQGYSQTVYIQNGSFEEHREGQYPNGRTGLNNWPALEFMKCLNFCPTNAHPNIPYPLTACYLDSGWYSPTNSASPDYYHRIGTEQEPGDPRVPFVRYRNRGYDTLEPTLRYDSAYVGIGINMYRPLFSDKNIENTYKEYIQRKLSISLTGGTYHVRFYVVRSIYSKEIPSICAYFSSLPILNPTTTDNSRYNYNLSRNTITNEFIYINSSQHNAVCNSQKLLLSTENSMNKRDFERWQEIQGLLVVPQDSIYNYITIGNFNNKQLFSDFDKENILQSQNYEEDLSLFDYYYFIDDIIIIPANECTELPCHCQDNIFIFKTEKNYNNNDTTKCCYEINLTIPEPNIPLGICPISKIVIKKNTVVIYELNNEGNNLNSGNYSDVVCLDKFNTNESNIFTLLYYAKDANNNEIILNNCTKSLDLKCLCQCSDFADYPTPKNKPKIYFKKSNPIANKCCWDIVCEYPDSSISNTCEFDMTNEYLSINSNFGFGYYQVSSENLILSPPYNGLSKFFKFPDNFKIKPGDVKVLGKICNTKNPPDENFQKFSISINSSNNTSDTCKTIVTQTLTCDTSANCCDNFKLLTTIPNEWSNYGFVNRCFNELMPNHCCVPIILESLNSNTNCNLNDTFSVYVYSPFSQVSYLRSSFIPSNLITNKNLLTFVELPNNSFNIVCMDIVNQRTNDSCRYCDSIFCSIVGSEQMNESEEIKLFKQPDRGYSLFSDSILDVKLVNNSIEFILRSNFEGNVTFYLTDLLGNKIISESRIINFHQNSFTIPITDLSNGLYYLNVIINSEIIFKPIFIIK